MNETGVIPIIQGFLTDIADVSWSEYAKQYTGKFPARLDTLYRIGLWDDRLYIFTVDEDKKEYGVRFKIKDESLYWTHDYGPDYGEFGNWYNVEPKCRNVDALHLADPKFFVNFVQVICLNLGEPALFEFILKRIINKPKWRAMCPESRMRNCRRRARYEMSCEEISEFIWKS